jgi:hypothetical protein
MVNTHDAARDVVTRYFQGIFEGDVALLARAFHPGAVLFGVVSGVASERTLDAYLAVVANRASPRALGELHTMKIDTIDVVGPFASVRATVAMLGHRYTDLLALAPYEGRLVIVNKLFTDHPA